MYRLYLSVLVTFSLLIGGVFAVPVSAPVKTLAIINAAELPAAVIEEIRLHAQKQLRVPVRAQSVKLAAGKSLKSLAVKLQEHRTTNDVCVVVLVLGSDTERLHATVERFITTATVNVAALRSDDPPTMLKRLERHVMRGFGFLFGLEPAPDPFCVTRHYRTLKELDKMGMNFCPPYQHKFKAEALRRGMTVLAPVRRPK